MKNNIKSTFIDMMHSLAPNPDSNLNNPNLKTSQNIFMSQNVLTFDFVTKYVATGKTHIYTHPHISHFHRQYITQARILIPTILNNLVNPNPNPIATSTLIPCCNP